MKQDKSNKFFHYNYKGPAPLLCEHLYSGKTHLLPDLLLELDRLFDGPVFVFAEKGSGAADGDHLKIGTNCLFHSCMSAKHGTTSQCFAMYYGIF